MILTPDEARAMDEELQEIPKLRENRMYLVHYIAELERLRAEHRAAMNDKTLSPELRCEHITAHEICVQLLEFPAKEEARMREALHEFDMSHTGAIERPFARRPIA